MPAVIEYLADDCALGFVSLLFLGRTPLPHHVL